MVVIRFLICFFSLLLASLLCAQDESQSFDALTVQEFHGLSFCAGADDHNFVRYRISHGEMPPKMLLDGKCAERILCCADTSCWVHEDLTVEVCVDCGAERDVVTKKVALPRDIDSLVCIMGLGTTPSVNDGDSLCVHDCQRVSLNLLRCGDPLYDIIRHATNDAFQYRYWYSEKACTNCQRIVRKLYAETTGGLWPMLHTPTHYYEWCDSSDYSSLSLGGRRLWSGDVWKTVVVWGGQRSCQHLETMKVWGGVAHVPIWFTGHPMDYVVSSGRSVCVHCSASKYESVIYGSIRENK